VSIQGFTYLFLLRGLLHVLRGFHVHLPLEINPGTPVFTTELNQFCGTSWPMSA
jgi:hypothetical protein